MVTTPPMRVERRWCTRLTTQAVVTSTETGGTGAYRNARGEAVLVESAGHRNESDHREHFDIDWSAPKLLVPALATGYGKALEQRARDVHETRGAADDGYAAFAAITAIEALQASGTSHHGELFEKCSRRPEIADFTPHIASTRPSPYCC